MSCTPCAVPARIPAIPIAAFRAQIEEILFHEALRNMYEVPGIDVPGTDNIRFNRAYYLRHRIETVRRVRMTARTDALALAAMIDEDYEAARRWAKYTVEEMQHDRLFLADLAQHGWDTLRVLATPPLAGTVALVNYLTRQIALRGGIAAVAYSILVEWNSARFSRHLVDRAEQEFGKEFVKGSRAHLHIDAEEDHLAEMVGIAYLLVNRADSMQILRCLLVDIAALLRDSFIELHHITSDAGAVA